MMEIFLDYLIKFDSIQSWMDINIISFPQMDQKILEPTELEKAKPRNIKMGKDWKIT